MSFPNVKKLLLSHFSNHLVLNNFKQWKLISSINFVAFQSAFLSIFCTISDVVTKMHKYNKTPPFLSGRSFWLRKYLFLRLMARSGSSNNVGKFQTSVKQYLCFSHFPGHDMAAEK